MEAYELIIRGGRVIDPKNARDEIADVAVQNGKIAAVGGFERRFGGNGCGRRGLHRHPRPD
ncbi:MAG: hypothetical protein PUE61_00075 [Clostridiales bacterium]|nr:hypothetical protein [Clostridiales bacterium]